MSDMSEERRTGYIRALLEEKAAYEGSGKHDRAAEVEAELVRIGAAGKPPAKRSTKRKGA